MSFDLTDLVRSIVVGQSAFMLVLTVIYAGLTIAWRRPRLGFAAGWILTTIAQLDVSIFVVVVMIDRINTGTDMGLWTTLGVVYVITGNLGVSLLTAHIILHNDELRERIKGWLGHRD